MICLPNLILRNLVWFARGGKGLPPPGTDIRQLSREGFQTPLFPDEMFQETWTPSIPLPQWQWMTGTVRYREGIPWFLPGDGGPPVAPAEHFRTEFGALPHDGSHILLTHDPGDPALCEQILVPEGWFRLADPFPNPGAKALLMDELLSLPGTLQETVIRFLSDEAYAQQQYPSICDLFSLAWDTFYFPDQKEISHRTDLSASEREAYQLVALCIPEDFPEKNGICVLLSLWALLHGSSIWNEGSLISGLIRSGLRDNSDFIPCLSLLLTGDETETLAKNLMEHYANFPGDAKPVRGLLYGLLQVTHPLKQEMLEQICRFLYDRGNAELLYIEEVMNGCHAAAFTKCIRQLHREAFSQGQDVYARAMAAVNICLLDNDRETVLHTAEQMLLQNLVPGADLTGACMLLFQLEADTHRIIHHRDPLILEQEELVLQRLRIWLTCPKAPHYRTACELARRLQLSNGIDGKDLADESILAAACDAWKHNAEQVCNLLAVFPPLYALSAEPCLAPIRAAAEERFRCSLFAKERGTLIRDFRVCAALCVWGRDDLFRSYSRLLAHLDRQQISCTEEEREDLWKLQYEMLQLLLEGNPGTGTDACLIPLRFLPPTAEERCQVEQILDNHGYHTVTEQAEAMLLLRYFRESWNWGTYGTEISANVFSRCRFQVSDAGSCLVADWFYTLCALNLAREAADFYDRFTVMLDRPWRFTPSDPYACTAHPFREDNQFWNCASRLVRGTAIAFSLGHTETIQALLPRISPLGSQREDLLQLKRVREVRNPDRRLLYNTMMEEHRSEDTRQLLEYWSRHYDDPGLTRMLLENYPNTHPTILHFGYRGIRPMVIAAMGASADSICHVAAPLLKDNAVCRAAMENSCHVLNQLRGSIIQDRPLVWKLLRRQQEELSLREVTPWLRDDPRFVLDALRRNVDQFHLVSPRLRGNKTVVLAALDGARKLTVSNYWKKEILRLMDPALRNDPEILRAAGLPRKQRPSK